MKVNAIKKSLILTSLLIGLGLIATGCGKSGSGGGSVSGTDPITQPTKIEGPPQANHNVKPLDLGIAESFAIIAYTSVASTPTSSVKGKVGLKPGTRSLIELENSEVERGSESIYAGNDSGDKANYLTIAREELIAAYRDAAARPFDVDKNESYAGIIGGKTLPPGIYKWSTGVKIESDVTLEGTSKDVWIFQIEGNVSLAAGVRVKLEGGAKARNVFWQISGKVDMDANSESVGTMISQLVFEMKTAAKLTGRAFVKNGKLIMNQSIIEIP